MVSRFFTCFSTFEMFIHFQHGLRRRTLDLCYKLFRNQIFCKINYSLKNNCSNQKFISTLNDLINLPENIMTDESERGSIIRSADKTVNGIYNLLGSDDVLISPVQWHTDFKTGFTWTPGTYYRNYRQEDIDTDSDVKVPRELSRSHHLLKLGLAYRLTKNQVYADVCVAQVLNWIDENPLMYSINWGCTMDVAIRAVNWIWALGLISGSDALDGTTIEKIKTSLYQHGWFIWRNPEKAPYYNGNHYLADLSGQIILGLLFRDLPEPGKWLQKGKEELFREIRIEILPSGMSYERSTNYNRLVLELILVPVLLLKKRRYEIPQDVWYRIEKMFDFIMCSLKPDGTSPIIGDQDNGRLLPLNRQETIDFRYLLSLGALLFSRSDLKYHGEGFNIFCSIFGGQGANEEWQSIPDLKYDLGSMAFPDVGLYLMRKNQDYLIFNATGRGLYPETIAGSHTHSDLFSFELFTYGKSFLVDPGSYVYTANADQRMLFRSTKMHNTVTVDGESQDLLLREHIWSYNRNAIPQVLSWTSNEDHDKITAVHNGYLRLPEPVQHERTIIFNKTDCTWIIKDRITGCGQHTLEWFFHFDVGIDFIINENIVETKCKDEKNIMMIFEPVNGLQLRKERSYISKSYGIKEEGYVLAALINDRTPVEITINIMKIVK